MRVVNKIKTAANYLRNHPKKTLVGLGGTIVAGVGLCTFTPRPEIQVREPGGITILSTQTATQRFLKVQRDSPQLANTKPTESLYVNPEVSARINWKNFTNLSELKELEGGEKVFHGGPFDNDNSVKQFMQPFGNNNAGKAVIVSYNPNPTAKKVKIILFSSGANAIFTAEANPLIKSLELAKENRENVLMVYYEQPGTMLYGTHIDDQNGNLVASTEASPEKWAEVQKQFTEQVINNINLEKLGQPSNASAEVSFVPQSAAANPTLKTYMNFPQGLTGLIYTTSQEMPILPGNLVLVSPAFALNLGPLNKIILNTLGLFPARFSPPSTLVGQWNTSLPESLEQSIEAKTRKDVPLSLVARQQIGGETIKQSMAGVTKFEQSNKELLKQLQAMTREQLKEAFPNGITFILATGFNGEDHLVDNETTLKLVQYLIEQGIKVKVIENSEGLHNQLGKTDSRTQQKIAEAALKDN